MYKGYKGQGVDPLHCYLQLVPGNDVFWHSERDTGTNSSVEKARTDRSLPSPWRCSTGVTCSQQMWHFLHVLHNNLLSCPFYCLESLSIQSVTTLHSACLATTQCVTRLHIYQYNPMPCNPIFMPCASLFHRNTTDSPHLSPFHQTAVHSPNPSPIHWICKYSLNLLPICWIHVYSLNL
jgi:hypothetical protein